MKLTRRPEINEYRVWILHFEKDGEEIGFMYKTCHPRIPFEVYRTDTLKNKRVMNEDEAEEFLLNGLS